MPHKLEAKAAGEARAPHRQSPCIHLSLSSI